MKKIFPYLILAVLVAVVVYFWQQQTNTITSPGQNSDEQSLAVSFVFAEGQTTDIVYPYDNNSPESLFKITKQIANEQNWAFNFTDYGELGLLVTQIDTKVGGDNNSYWLYYVNGEQPQIAVEKYTPSAGDDIEWKFEPSTY